MTKYIFEKVYVGENKVVCCETIAQLRKLYGKAIEYGYEIPEDAWSHGKEDIYYDIKKGKIFLEDVVIAQNMDIVDFAGELHCSLGAYESVKLDLEDGEEKFRFNIQTKNGFIQVEFNREVQIEEIEMVEMFLNLAKNKIEGIWAEGEFEKWQNS